MINSGKDAHGQVDYADWFLKQGVCSVFKHVLDGDAEAVSKCSQHQVAMARRTVVFVVDRPLLKEEAKARGRAQKLAHVQAKLERERQLFPQLA